MQVKGLNVICVMVIFLLSAASSAKESPKRPRADLNVWEVVSAETASYVYRAIKGYDEIYPFLVIEKVSRPQTEGDEATLLCSWRLRDMAGSEVMQPAMEGDDIKDMKWANKTLEFSFSRAHVKKICTISNIDDKPKPTVSCRPSK